LVDENFKAQDGKKDGIYLCDFRSYLKIALQVKKGATYQLFENLDKIFVDEFHAFLASSHYITCDNFDFNSNYALTKASLLSRFNSYKHLTKEIESLSKEYPNLIAQSNKRNQACFNPHQTSIDDTLVQHYLYDKYTNHHQNILDGLQIGSYYQFVTILDKISDALSKQIGKDYYIFKENGNIKDYCVAENATGKPLHNTVFQDKELATIIALKHSSDISKDKYKDELMFIAKTYTAKTTSKITPFESLQLLDAKNFVTASATLKGVSKQLHALAFETHFLQEEFTLDTTDTKVTISKVENTIEDILPKFNLLDATHTQIAITSQNAHTLKQLYNQLEKTLLQEYKLVKLYRNPINPNDEQFKRGLENTKQEIYHNPYQKRILLIQGLGEGSNIFKTTPHGEYQAKLYKLDINAIDKVTQTRYRVGAKGRVDGEFNHTISTSLSHGANITHDELKELEYTNDITQTIIEIQENILADLDNDAVAYVESKMIEKLVVNNSDFDVSRREFFDKVAALGAVAMGTTLGVGTKANAAYLMKDSELPPGIANCRDTAVIMAYKYWERDGVEQTDNGIYRHKDIAKAILKIDKNRGMMPVPTYIKDDTPFVEPAYWFVRAKINDSYNSEISVQDLKKKGYDAMAYFSTATSRYFDMWVRREQNYRESIEENYLKAIFIAAGRNENDVKGYMKMKLNEKEQFLSGIMNSFEKESYNNLLIGSWAGFFLVNHYDQINKNGGDFFFKMIEKPLRIFTHKEGKYIRVRGPPYYYDSKGKFKV
jgi:hypothetical protein